jgi:hypothetical protein
VGAGVIAEALASLEGSAEGEPAGPPSPTPPIEVAPIEINSAARRETLKRWLGSIAALVLAVVVCAAVYAVWQRFHTAPMPAGEPDAPPSAPASQPAAPASEIPPVAAPAPPPAAVPALASAAPIALEIRTAQETWIRVTSDGKVAFAGTLEAGQSRTFQAQANMNLLTGNAGGLEAVFNGKPLGPLGPLGQIRVLELTPAEHRILERRPPPEP